MAPEDHVDLERAFFVNLAVMFVSGSGAPNWLHQPCLEILWLGIIPGVDGRMKLMSDGVREQAFSPERPKRGPGRILLTALNGVTAFCCWVLTLLALASLWEHGRYDVLGLMAGTCIACWVFAYFGPRQTVHRRIMVVALLVLAAVAWLKL
jgi:hypothetical protein